MVVFSGRYKFCQKYLFLFGQSLYLCIDERDALLYLGEANLYMWNSLEDVRSGLSVPRKYIDLWVQQGMLYEKGGKWVVAEGVKIKPLRKGGFALWKS